MHLPTCPFFDCPVFNWLIQVTYTFIHSFHTELPSDTFMTYICSDLNFLHEIMHVVIPIFIGYLHIHVLKTKCRCLVYRVLLKVSTLPLFPQICERKKTFVVQNSSNLKLSSVAQWTSKALGSVPRIPLWYLANVQSATLFLLLPTLQKGL